ncbi:MAG: dTDP-4-amino-4,6-dideoxygalactose transaminase [Verrucomicrobia bacterium]|nr:MAG: dTDP-4-amino-4,6-dideoxygalactose transaminase [Verrucomicrobiota bacterium]
MPHSAPIPFNKPHLTGREAANIDVAHGMGHLSGDGHFTRLCSAWLEATTGAKKALLTHSCTAALEMAAFLAGIQPGDEVIMPSYTFVSTANAFVLRGGVPVFIDIRPDTLNLDEGLVEQAVTPRTRAIVPVHYAGVACEMDPILAIGRKHGLMVVEDAAQGILSAYRGKPLGSLGDLGAFSFHETKNIICGEGGALLVRNPALVERAEIIREKGTNRARFFRGEIDKYTWVDVGSSYLPGEIVTAFLWAQIEEAHSITRRRLRIWDRYHAAFESAERSGRLRRPVVPAHCTHNAHMYYLVLADLDDRTRFIASLRNRGIHCVFHYVPLHSSPAGRERGRAHGDLPVTLDRADRLVRLPLWLGLEAHQDRVIDEILAVLRD